MRINKKFLKKILIILTMLAFIFTLYKIGTTYALLQSETNSSIVQEIGKWNIKLNESDITNGLSQEVVIDNFSMDENANVKSGKIAPGVSGSLEIVLDPVDTQVAVRFDVSFESIEEEQIELVSIEQIDGTSEVVRTGENTYSGIMNLSEINNKTAKTTIKIVIKWENNEENNVSDTVIGTSTGYKLKVPIKVNVSQYLGETLEEYNG